jgi:hypothetical protein
LAQGSITGVINDSSWAVLPGVSVEISSPVLIEKVRTAVTDGTGAVPRIDLDLQVGAWSVRSEDEERQVIDRALAEASRPAPMC